MFLGTPRWIRTCHPGPHRAHVWQGLLMPFACGVFFRAWDSTADVMALQS
jgi:hypothetical protein